MRLTETLRKLEQQGWSYEDCAYRFGVSVQDILRRLNPSGPGKVPLYTRQVSLKLDAETHDRVLAMARAEGSNQAVVLRDLIEWGLATCD